MVEIEPTDGPLGARVEGVDLASPLSPTEVGQIRGAWLDHHVLAFPNQSLADDDLVRFARYFGPPGNDPFIDPIDGRTDVIAVHRTAEETAPVFAEAWHADWSFQQRPPQGTCLYGLVIPPEGGDTLFANQHLAWEQMPQGLAERVRGVRAVHSARASYGVDGVYGENDSENERAMSIRYSSEAHATHSHPWVCEHPETGRAGLYGCAGYICGIEGLDPDAARELIIDVYRHQTSADFVYRHRWEPNMLVMWDNRSVLHMATGGYDGHERLLHRCTVGSDREPIAPTT